MVRVATVGAVLALICAKGYALEVGYAGFAYAGDFQSIQSRFPYTSQIIPPHTAQGYSGPSEVEQKLLGAVRGVKSKNFEVVTDSLATLGKGDRAVMVALVATGETVSTERIADLTKVFINLQAQVLFFDFKSMTVLRAYPVSVVYLGAPRTPPTGAEVLEIARSLIVGGEQPGLIEHFVSRLERASLPDSETRFIGITDVSISENARPNLPASLSGSGVAEAWIAEQLSDALLDRVGVPMLPYSKDYAIGHVMSMQISDGTVFNLKIPAPDYSIDMNLQALKKVAYAQVPAGTSYIYGVSVHLLLQEPMLQHRFFDSNLKNGEIKLVPASQSTVDDWPAFEESIAGLFKKLSATISGEDVKWIRSAVASGDVMKQIEATRRVLNSCK